MLAASRRFDFLGRAFIITIAIFTTNCCAENTSQQRLDESLDFDTQIAMGGCGANYGPSLSLATMQRSRWMGTERPKPY